MFNCDLPLTKRNKSETEHGTKWKAPFPNVFNWNYLLIPIDNVKF